MSDTSSSTTASAPATVGNVAVGFDILGFALEAVDDRITVRRIDEPIVRIKAITGTATDLPTEADRNTATAGLLQLIEEIDVEGGFEVEIDKGIPLGSGTGGSAASAVGGIVAAASLLEMDLSRETMMHYALIGETIASGDRHGDNIAPSLFGGLTLVRVDPPDVIELPVPEGLTCVLVHPHVEIETSRARAVVPGAFELSTYVEQSTRLGGLIAGCYRGDVDLIGESLEDVLIEPHRASLVPGFE